MTERLKCMFDSNIFDELIDRPDLVELIDESIDLYVTHVQINENEDTPHEEAKVSLRRVRDSLAGALVSTESSVFDISEWDRAKWSKDNNLLTQIQGSVRPDAGKLYVNKTRDALIAETAIENGYLLVTEDKPLRNKVASLGGKSMSWEQLLEHCRS